MSNPIQKKPNSYRVMILVGLLLVLVISATAIGAAPAAETSGLQVPDEVAAERVYIVQMSGAPVVAYEGDVNGLAATKPNQGKKINPNSGKVKKYTRHLNDQHDAAVAAVGGTKIYSYQYSFNGFAAVLTPAEAVAMEKRSDVVAVWVDELRQVETDNSPDFLGLTAPGGLYEQGIDGEDVIIGVIDTGIWPEHPSFSDQVDFEDRPGESGKGTRVYGPPPADWHGICRSGERWSQDDCNNKLIGARYYKGGQINNLKKGAGGFLSARDEDGHGTHTASTAGGNAGVPASIFGIDRGTVSGIAPRARIAAYKGCWSAGCFTSDLVMSIDDAVADGVDVINYSIGSSATTLGPDDISFLYAADAGVYVATSNGNAGPDPETTGAPAWTPWITSVGASTQDRAFISDITVEGPDTPPIGVWGGSITSGVDDYNLVDSEGVPDVTGDTSGLCVNAFVPGTFQSDDAVLCNDYDFGVARVQRVENVAAGGGGAVIFHNSAVVSMTPTDNHVLPTVHVLHDVGTPLKTYLVDNPGAVTVSFTQGKAIYPPDPRVEPYVMASFSSRGPNGGAFDIIKPDITAPGVNILAGASPEHADAGAQGQLFQSIMGTSMSSPHVAGAFALLKDAHPGWSAAMAKSALMTTASQGVLKEDGVTAADPFDMGAGHLNPNPAVDPGLVYDAGFFDYLGFLCGNNPANIGQGTCDFVENILGLPTDPSNLNHPSIGIADLVGVETVMRTVTNVGEDGDYTVSWTAPPGIDVSVSPASLTIASGDTATFAVTFTTTSGATLEEWAFGDLTWSDGAHEVRSPIAVRPTEFSAPAEIVGSGISGAASFDVTFGYTGSYTAGNHGLVLANETAGNVLDDPTNDIDGAMACWEVTGGTLTTPGDPACGLTLHLIAVPAGTAHARFSLFDAYVGDGDGSDDLDMYVYHPSGDEAGSSGSATSDEQVDVEKPEVGNYSVFIQGWQTTGPSADYTLFDWLVPLATGGSLSIDSAPTAAVLGNVETIDVSWTGLTADKMYLGAVSHTGPSGLLGLTLVAVDS